ncbi:MurR/RpiR family transcriptional regulator [Paenibacillus sp. N1-5-1-14]|uniref:MurR/RpiR family transcriptional regulator n=1 Tax=Paenibacillus radicibacter TaxID=2972488 RepID=UPI002158E3A4|nr:MurR/RpiR family transcriptional regulator [Paenibacillus radicibacter]MCR8645529.1 MurR/RpiR family transcriptional regulator [Paenibacillus radicibacter]
MNGGLVKLKEIYDQLNPSEQKVAKYILKHPEQMIRMSIAQLSEVSGASQAAIVRLCKSLEVRGYQDLKIRIAGDLHQVEEQGYQDIRMQDSLETIIQNVTNNNIQSIRDTVKILDAKMVEQAVEALHRAKRIFFYGVGASNLIAQDAQQKFFRINKTSFAFADPSMQLTTSVTLTKEDVAVGISYSGETPYVIGAIKHAKSNGAKTISISKYGTSSLSPYIDIPLSISSTDSEIRSGAIASRISQLNVIDMLYICVASKDYENSVDYLNRTRKAIREVENK